MSVLSERIRSVMDVKNVRTSKQLSQLCNITESTLSRQLNDERSVNIDTIMSILEVFPDVSAEWLLRGNGDILIQSAPVKYEYSSDNFLHTLCEESIENLEDMFNVFKSMLSLKRRNNQK